MLLVIATLLPHPFQNIAMHLTMEKQQLQQQLTLKLKKLCLKPTHCPRLYTEQQKKRIFFIYDIVYKLGVKYRSNDV